MSIDQFGADGNYGWRPFDERTVAENQAHDSFVASRPPFAIVGAVWSTERVRVCLWECSKKLRGKHLLTSRQNIGSCVGHGKYNAERTLMDADIVIRGDAEEPKELFEPYGYGRSRYHAGIGGSGDGSTGSGAAKAAMADGVLLRDLSGLSGWSESGDTINWSGQVDHQWSNGSRIDDKWLTEGRKHLVRSAAMVTTYEQVRDAIANGYPVTVASNRGFRAFPEDKGKRWGTPGGSWAHQMCFIGVDDDPARPGAYCWNSWGASAHPAPVDDAPPGGFWVDAEVVASMVRQQDSFAFSQFDGFPAQRFDTLLI